MDVDQLTELCEKIIKENPKMVAQYKKGKSKILYAMAGDIFKQTEHRANMAIVVEILTKLLK